MKKIVSKKFLLILTIFILSILFVPQNIYATDYTTDAGDTAGTSNAKNSGKIPDTTKNDLEVDGFNIIPELDDAGVNKINNAIEEIGQKGGSVMETYNAKASTLTTSEQISSGIMNWDTIMNYLVYVVQFLSQLGLVVGTVFIIYAGYMYMLSVFKGGKTPSSSIKNAIIGILIVIFSYAIMRALTSVIGLT